MILKRTKLSILFLVASFFLLRLPLVGFDIINEDAPAWNYRSVQFWSYLKNLDFAETYRTYHPGVTVMWVAGFGNELLSTFYKLQFGKIPNYDIVSNFHLIYFFETAFLIFATFGLLVLFYFLISKLFSNAVAFWATFILLFEPFFIGNTRVLHLDGLLSLFLINSFILFVLYLLRGNFKYLIFSGVFFGFSLLTKISALSLLPAFAITSFIYLLNKKSGFILSVKAIIKPNLLFSASAILTFILFFPAIWVKPTEVFRKILFDGILATGQGTQPQVFFGEITGNPGVFFYPLNFIYRTSPLLLILIIYFFYKFSTISRKIKGNITPFFVFIFVYLLFMTISIKKIDRYLLPLFPPLALISACGVDLFLQKVKRKGLVLLSSTISYLLLIVPIFPDFFAYFNPLFGGTQLAVKVVGLQDWASGYQRVVNYLHSNFSNIENKTIATYNHGSVKPIFLGKVVSIDKVSNFQDMDFVIMQRGDSRISKVLQYMKLEKIFYIGSYDYYYLYKNNKI